MDPMTAEEFLERYETATRSHDLESVLGMIGDDAIYLFSDKSTHVGKGAIERALRKNFEAIKCEDYRIDNIAWLIKLPGVAVCVYDYRWSGLIDGKLRAGSGRGTSAMAATLGRWQIVHEHLSAGSLVSRQVPVGDGSLGSAAWDLWRQDDGGNKYLVSSFGDEKSAEKSMTEYENKGHKQVYWVQRRH